MKDTLAEINELRTAGAHVTDESKLNDIMQRHSLSDKWRRFKQNYLNPS